nr:WUSCHEL-related homeobox 11-like isoform X2 [Coffea arabica]XP_027073053.1 WUSCHEL-related homeobox 11-like isoform X2 [Coffea arabica]
MEDQEQDQTNQASHGSESSERNEPVRSRWTPKPEQILILESIFNSGMVNPPKDETVRIRKLLEKFGSVGDANVFYWFQNRRSRSRRRQRQIQASLSGEVQVQTRTAGATATAIPYETSCCAGFSNSMSFLPLSASASSASCLGQIGQPEIAQTSSSINPRSHYQSGLISVFINGVATELPRGPFDLRATFGQDFLLFHSSGVPVSVSEYGFLLESLQHGESYFLVQRPV